MSADGGGAAGAKGLPLMISSPQFATMNTINPLLSVLLFITLSSSGWARLGETLEQCISRYGQPDMKRMGDKYYVDGKVGDIHVFDKKMRIGELNVPIRIYITIVDGTAQRIRYRRDISPYLTDEIRQNFLSLNGWEGEAKMYASETTPDQKRRNPGLRAGSSSSEVLVERVQLIEKEKQKEKQSADTSTQGF